MIWLACKILGGLAELCSTIRILFYVAYVGLDWAKLKLEEYR